MLPRIYLSPLLFAAACQLVLAGESMTLQSSQIKALGIETTLVSQSGSAGGLLPARVLVPNEQLRVVAAPVGGMVEMLAVAPGSKIGRAHV